MAQRFSLVVGEKEREVGGVPDEDPESDVSIARQALAYIFGEGDASSDENEEEGEHRPSKRSCTSCRVCCYIVTERARPPPAAGKYTGSRLDLSGI